MKVSLFTLLGAIILFGGILLEAHIAVIAILLILVFITGYSFSTTKEQVAPEDFHREMEDDIIENPISNEDSKECPVCHTENHINRKYCKKCNTLIQNIVCPVCQTKNSHDAKYCVKCDSILQNKKR
jgi:RNA polymerase subunit RPABC4/transcription elongation factor Spt4